MKTVFKDISDIAHLWAHQTQIEAKNPTRNFYFDGDTIYSYGRHFPIARHYKGKILLTLRTYSVTTSTHINTVSSAISHKDKIYCFDLPSGRNDKTTHLYNISKWFEGIQSNIEKLKTARKPELYVGAIETIKNYITEYKKYFPVALTSEQKKTFSITDASEFKELAKKQIENEVKYQLSIEVKGNKLNAEYLAAWKQGKESEKEFNKKLTGTNRRLFSDYNRLHVDSNTTYLRLTNNEIETSKGIKVPVDVARRFYNWYMKIEKKGCDGCKYEILGYAVNKADSSGLVVGCHHISRAEIDATAKALKWV